MEGTLRVAAAQMNSTPYLKENLAQAHDLLLQAADRSVDILAFPENFLVFAETSEQLHAQAETLKGVMVESLQEWAADYGIWIVAGSLPVKAASAKAAKGKKSSPKITNTCLVIDPEGTIKARYDKIHLFDANIKDGQSYRESNDVKAGTKPVRFESPWGYGGLSICYDVRFPELYRKLSAMPKGGTDFFFIPSAFTAVTGKAHWDLMTRARAVENQAFVIAPAQVGSPYPGRQTHGHTRIIDPWGRTLAERPKGVGIVWADLKSSEVERIRGELPALSNRKLKV